eukprot:CAMPEP_0116875104 /NCGR_PEP_ID=MMETSP0463-20121206/6889_1 /TAXON_ID=181622 /ORGANISM="Strombidinopsis sp, Strain SopsisLIS2011" /LENGTH=58 /DNA_ID=CAMNT_0004520061 /DNA_START=81 /DNA_END=257 /DNA_ORIENTATION=+
MDQGTEVPSVIDDLLRQLSGIRLVSSTMINEADEYRIREANIPRPEDNDELFVLTMNM